MSSLRGPLRFFWLRPASGACAWLLERRTVLSLVGCLALLGAPPLPAQAIPRLDLQPYPAPAPGESRWVIQLPGVLRPGNDLALSPNPAEWQVELIVGRPLEVDCNRTLLRGQIRAETVPGWGYAIYRASGGEVAATTRMACPPDQPRRRTFVPLAGPPTLVPYNASLPIVVYAPRALEVRWRLWKPERRQQTATRL